MFLYHKGDAGNMLVRDGDRYVFEVYDELDKKICAIFEELYWELRRHEAVIDGSLKDTIPQVLKIVERVGKENADEILFLLGWLSEKYGAEAVKVALNRELHLRERNSKKGGRPSVVERYCREIDAIIEGYRDNPLLSPDENAKLREEKIRQLLNEAREKYAKATYLKIRRYAVGKTIDKTK